MAASFYSGSFTTASGGNTITGIPGQPVALIFWVRPANSESSGATGIAASYGFATPNVALTGVLNAAVAAQLGTFTTSGGHSLLSNSASLAVLNVGGGSDLAGSVASFTSDGFTVSYTTYTGGDWLVHYLAIYGSGVEAIILPGESTGQTVGMPQVLTGAGFQPEALIGLVSTGVAGSISSDSNVGFGFFDGATQCGSYAHFNSSTRGAWQKSARFILRGRVGTVDDEASVASLDSDGLTLNWATVTNAAFAILALRGVPLKVGTFTANTSTGSQAVTGIGGTPLAALFASTWQATTGTQAAPGTIAISGAAGSNAWDDAQASNASGSRSNTGHHTAASEVFVTLAGAASGSPTIVAAATLTSLDSDGWTWNWTATDGTAAEIVYVAFGVSNGLPQSYVYSASGGAAAGGGAVEARTVTSSTSGGLTSGGSSTASRTVAVAAVGGLTSGGSASVVRVVIYAPVAGATLGGSAGVSRSVVAGTFGGCTLAGAAAYCGARALGSTGGGAMGGTAGVLRCTNATGTGGTVIGGAASESRTVAVVFSGGTQVGGSASVLTTGSRSTSGGAIAGGAATVCRSVAIPPFGGIALGGSASVLRIALVAANGGLIASGSAPYSATRSLDAGGGASLAGIATASRRVVALSSGGPATGGLAGIARTAAVVGIGGAACSGTSPINYGRSFLGAGGVSLGGNSGVLRGISAAGRGGAALSGFAGVVRDVVVSGFGGGMVGGEASVLITLHSPRRVSRLRPQHVDIARARQARTGSVVEEAFYVILIGEPADIQSRSGSYFQADVGRVVARRFAGYFAAVADVKVGDRIVTTEQTFLVTDLQRKGRHLEADLEKVAA